MAGRKPTAKEYEQMCRRQFPKDKIADAKVQHYIWEIWTIGCDYEGYNTVKSLRAVIDELVNLSDKAMRGLKDVKKPKVKKSI